MVQLAIPIRPIHRVITMPIKRSSELGFTLIEMLVAVLMIAILFTLVFSAIDSATRSRQATMDAGKRLSDLQRAFIWMDQDINQLVDRPIRTGYGSSENALVHTDQVDGRVLEFSRGGWPNPLELDRSDIARVAYELEPDAKANSKNPASEVYNLYRLYWRDADRSLEEPTRKRRIARGVTGFSTRFMDEEKNWQESWPPLNQASDSTASLPRAVELELELQGWGKIRRVFRVVAAHGL